MVKGQPTLQERKKQRRATRWFERLDRLPNVKKIFYFILSKREISKEYLMDLIEDRKRKNLIEDHNRSDVAAIADVAEDLGVTLTDQHIEVIDYRDRKQKERHARKNRSQSNVDNA
jgi:hypothetical protein